MWQRFKSTRFFKVIRNKYLIVSLIFIVWICFFDNNNLVDWVGSLRDYSGNKSQQRYYKEQIRQTESKLSEIQSNKDSLEKFARENYYFHKENEDVFIVTPEPSDPSDRLPLK